MINILIAGDFVPQKSAAKKFDEGCFEDVLGEIRPVVEKTDFSLINLEAPIVEGEGVPIKKAGPNLKCSKSAIDALCYAGFKGVTLANNHFYDYGEEGALDTLSLLNKAGIVFVGAGKNLKEASRVLYQPVADKTLAFINCCEHEYSIATDQTAGSNPINPVCQYYAIKEAKAKADYIIVVVHGGIEGYRLPTPRMQDWYRFFIDCGADVVVNHHQHCYSGYEIYQGKPIFYGLGNFCFDKNLQGSPFWYEGYMVNLSFGEGDVHFEMIPYIQCCKNSIVELLVEKDVFFKEISQLNTIINDRDALDVEYKTYMDKTMKSQRYILCPYRNKYLAALFVRGYLPDILPLGRWRDLQNKIMCESHRERFLYFINNKLK